MVSDARAQSFSGGDSRASDRSTAACFCRRCGLDLSRYGAALLKPCACFATRFRCRFRARAWRSSGVPDIFNGGFFTTHRKLELISSPSSSRLGYFAHCAATPSAAGYWSWRTTGVFPIRFSATQTTALTGPCRFCRDTTGSTGFSRRSSGFTGANRFYPTGSTTPWGISLARYIAQAGFFSSWWSWWFCWSCWFSAPWSSCWCYHVPTPSMLLVQYWSTDLGIVNKTYVPPTELAWSNADLITPDLRLCQTGPMFDGHVISVYNPVLRASAMRHLGIRWIER